MMTLSIRFQVGHIRALTSFCGELFRRFAARNRKPMQPPITPSMERCTTEQSLVLSHRSDSIPAKKPASAYESEAQLVQDFLRAIRSDAAPIPAVQIGAEFDYRDGRTDVISVTQDGELIAFEAKLTQWKVALHQAYRATSFANRAYVVMPAGVATRVLAHRHEFDRRRVGLCAMQPDGTITVLHEAPRVVPYMPSVSTRAHEFLRAQN